MNYENMKIASNPGINNIIQRNGSYFLLFSKRKLQSFDISSE